MGSRTRTRCSTLPGDATGKGAWTGAARRSGRSRRARSSAEASRSAPDRLRPRYCHCCRRRLVPTGYASPLACHSLLRGSSIRLDRMREALEYRGRVALRLRGLVLLPLLLLLGLLPAALGHVGRVDRFQGGEALAAPRGPDQEHLLEQAVAVELGLGEQERAEAPFLLGPAADHGDLARLQDQGGGQVAEGLLLLAILEHEPLRGIAPGVRHRAEGVLDRAEVDLGDEPQRHAGGPLLLGRHPEPAA